MEQLVLTPDHPYYHLEKLVNEGRSSPEVKPQTKKQNFQKEWNEKERPKRKTFQKKKSPEQTKSHLTS